MMSYDRVMKEFYKKFGEPEGGKTKYFYTREKTDILWKWIKEKLEQERADAFNEGLRDY